jgi:hypothetical protein
LNGHRIVIGGLPYFGRMLADLIGGAGWRARYAQTFPAPPWAPLIAAREIAAAELVYLIGGQLRRWSRPDCLLRIVRRPVVMHWTGSDVGFARTAADDDQLSQRLLGVPQHWAEVPWIADELRPLGITAEVVPLTSTRMPARVAPLPDRFTVLSYLPHKRPDFYGQRDVMELAGALPDVPFLIAGNDGTGMNAPANVEFLGWQTAMEPVYQRATVLLRQPEHDGLSFMVLEALAAGRYVIWNHPIGGAIEAQTPAESLACLQRLLALHRRGALGFNEAGPACVRAGYATEQVRGDIRARFERLIRGES